MNFEAFKSVLLPVLMFIAGYLLSVLGKIFSYIRENRNLKIIFWKELYRNYQSLKKISPENGLDDLVKIQVAQRLGFYVFNAYLSQLMRLRRQQVDKVYEAYFWLSLVKERALAYGAFWEEFLKDKNITSEQKAKDALAAFQASIILAIPQVKAALDSLPNYEGGVSPVEEAKLPQAHKDRMEEPKLEPELSQSQPNRPSVTTEPVSDQTGPPG